MFTTEIAEITEAETRSECARWAECGELLFLARDVDVSMGGIAAAMAAMSTGKTRRLSRRRADQLQCPAVDPGNQTTANVTGNAPANPRGESPGSHRSGRLQVRAASRCSDERPIKHLGQSARLPVHSSNQVAQTRARKNQKLWCTRPVPLDGALGFSTSIEIAMA